MDDFPKDLCGKKVSLILSTNIAPSLGVIGGRVIETSPEWIRIKEWPYTFRTSLVVAYEIVEEESGK